MEGFETRKTEMYRLLEIYDGYEELQDVADSLVGFGCSAGYDEGILGKLSHVVRLIVDRTDSALYDRTVDFCDTELARILNDKNLDNRCKAEILTRFGK